MNNPNFSQEFAQLKSEYQAALPQKLQGVFDAWQTAKRKTNEDNLRSLYVMAHRLAGSTGLYGFQDLHQCLTQIAEQLENHLDYSQTLNIPQIEIFMQKITDYLE
jgi:chemotaxis protein histidine kinase CheA